MSDSILHDNASRVLFERALEWAPRLPANILLGTSTWTFEGWQGIVYHRKYPSKRVFTHESLLEYARCPVFRAVGVDSTYYRPVPSATYEKLIYAAPKIRFVVKAWQEITSHRFPERFLNDAIFKEACLEPFIAGGMPRSGAHLLLQFSHLPPDLITSGLFLDRLRGFLRGVKAAAPSELRLAVEVRNHMLLTRSYLDLLSEYAVDHVFSWSTEMPPLVSQLRAVADSGGIHGSRYMVRALIPPGFEYEETKALYAPFATIQRPDEQMQHDLQRVFRRGVETNREVIVLFNNKAEGSAPLSVARAILGWCESEREAS